MRVGVPKEIKNHEYRVGLTPASVAELTALGHEVIVETKAGASPTDLDRILWSQGHRPARLSKYGVGVAALDPSAPALKWHRVLTRDLGR